MDLSQCKELASHMLGIRSRREAAWRELSRWIYPSRGLFDERDRYDQEDMARFTQAASHAVLRGASGMSSGMTPRNISWFKPCFTDESMMEASNARLWLDVLDRRMKDYLASGGFYQAIQNFNIDLLWAGCALLYTEKDQPLRFESVQIGTFAVAPGQQGRLEAVLRQLSLPACEVKNLFGEASLSEATRQLASQRPYEGVRVWHLCRLKHDNSAQPVESAWYEDGGREFLRHSSYYEMPYFFTAWSEGSSPYGSGPGDECLADARQMDILERYKLAGLGKLVDPPVVCPPQLKEILDLSPGAINIATERDRISPILDLSPYASSLRNLQEEIRNVSQRLENGLMGSIFASMPLDQRPRDMSATEFLERKREALQQLGPVISAYEPTVLSPLLLRLVLTMDRAGLTPPVPQSLRGLPIYMKMDFISPMANALRQTGAETTRALFQDVAAIFKATQNQEIFDKVDMDQMVDELATGLGAPGSVIRSDEDVSRLRQQRAQAQAQQVQMQLALKQQELAARYGGRNQETEENEEF